MAVAGGFPPLKAMTIASGEAPIGDMEQGSAIPVAGVSRIAPAMAAKTTGAGDVYRVVDGDKINAHSSSIESRQAYRTLIAF
jgi:hypothetical protein